MARENLRLPGNAPGEFFVDATCIDCDTCRHVAPDFFTRDDREGMSVVHRQPSTPEERVRAAIALVSCPTASIGCKDKSATAEAVRRLPEPVAENVEYCGFASKDSYGASSWFLRREKGNVLVDSPRAVASLLEAFDERGGIRWMFLSHRDDVADHAKFKERFPSMDRVLHRGDVTRDTSSVERIIDGNEPVRLDDDLLVIPVPGHTRGSAALLYKNKFLFTGDHLWGDGEGHLGMGQGVCWYSWPEQVRSLERLLDFSFEWVLPGHERRFHAPGAAMRKELERLLKEVKGTAPI